MDNSPTYKVHKNFFNIFSYYVNLTYEKRKTFLLLLLHIVLVSYLITQF